MGVCVRVWAQCPLGELCKAPRTIQREEDPTEASTQEPTHKLHPDTCAWTALFCARVCARMCVSTPPQRTTYKIVRCACLMARLWGLAFWQMFRFVISEDHKSSFRNCSTIFQKRTYVYCMHRENLSERQGSSCFRNAIDVSVWSLFTESNC